ncbi:MAG: segregation and condensation protein A [Parvularculaceae bacterium]
MTDGEIMPPQQAGDEEAEGGEEPFDAPVRAAPDADLDALVVNLEGYEGPLDVLLELARRQKVDLRKLSMLALVEQYLDFVAAAKARNLELAADYLVMAAWLAYLKSRLLLPALDADGEGPTGDEMAARLAFQLQRLEAMRKSAEALLQLPRLGVNVFARGAPEGVRVIRTPEWQATLYDLLRAYASQRIAAVDRTYKYNPPKVYAVEEARARIERMLGSIPEWSELRGLAPWGEVDAPGQSLIASAFNAALEIAKDGRLDIRQLAPFEPIYVRSRSRRDENGGDGERTNS